MSEFLSDGTDEQEILDRNLELNVKKFQNIGYREGLFRAQSEGLQKGFDWAYHLQARLSLLLELVNATEGIELPMIEGEERFLWVSKELDRLIRDYSSASSRIDAFDMGAMMQTAGTITIFPPSTSTYEEHFIIRFPPGLAASVRADLSETGAPGDLEIAFNRTRPCIIGVYNWE